MPSGKYIRKNRNHALASYKRVFRDYHYQAKKLDFDVFLKLVKQNCYYCNSPARMMNPYGKVYKRKSSTDLTEAVWKEYWIQCGGVDKISPADDYADESNLAPACMMCNWLKGTFEREEFIMQCNKIAAMHPITELAANGEINENQN